MDRLTAMRAFVAVAAHGSFTEAARRLRLSPSVVTRLVAHLEDELGLMLLNRTTRSVRLTERGQIHLESCRQILDDLDAASEWRFGTGEIAVRVAPRLAVNSADAAIAAAEAGLGITRAISYQVRGAVLAGRLVPVLQAFAPPPLPVSAVHPPRRIGSANVAAFIKAARDHFRTNPLVPIEAA